MSIKATAPEIRYALECGYTEIYLQSDVISVNNQRIFREFIGDLYEQRLEKKRKMKQEIKNKNYDKA